MNLKQQVEALRKEAETANEKATKQPTEENLKAAEDALTEYQKQAERLARNRATTAALKAIDDAEMTEEPTYEDPQYMPHTGSLGSVKTSSITDTSRTKGAEGFAKAFEKALIRRNIKSTNELVNGQPVQVIHQGQIVSDVKARYNLMNKVKIVPVTGGSGQYLQQTTRENNFATVQRHGLKPVSNYAVEAKQWELATIATVTEPMARQWMQDIPSLAQFLAAELGYGLTGAVNEFILTGGTSENGNEVPGILTTTGIGEQEYAGDPLTSVRRALTELEIIGVRPNGLIMHPRAWEAFDLMTDNDGRRLMTHVGGDLAVPRLFDQYVTLVKELPENLALVADWDTVNLLDRGLTEIVATDAGTAELTGSELQSLWQRNQFMTRAEGRYGLTLVSLPSIRTIQLEATD